ncbi:MAG: FHA domain-containing protein [Myxococcales bacterium]
MPRLRGLGREIPLRGRAVLGRDPACDVVLDDASVSRRHAVLETAASRFTLRDLSSANGTFVDGVRVGKSVALSGGARLRFGDVELQLVADAPRAFPVRPAIAVLSAIVVAAVLASVLRGRASQATAPASLARPALALVEEAQAALEADRPEEAETIAQKAVDADPLLEGAGAALARAKREREAARLYGEAGRAADSGNATDALHLLARVPQEARLFARARIKAKEIAAAASLTRAAACRTDASAGRWAQAAVECAAALDITCQTPSAAPHSLLAVLRGAEKRAGRKVPWSCPADLASVLRDDAPGAPAVAPDLLLAQRYADPKIRAAIAVYVHGEPSEAMRALSRLHTAEARAAADRIRRVEGRSREGRTAVLAGDLLRADRAYAEALRADGEIVPKGVDSLAAKQVREALGHAHGSLGDEYFAKGQYASAFDEWQAAAAAQPRDPHFLDALAKLDEMAQGIARDSSASCTDLRVAAHVSTPSGPAREAAERALSRCR